MSYLTVQKVRDMGFEANVAHYRWASNGVEDALLPVPQGLLREMKVRPQGCGGMTFAVVRDESGQCATSYALCRNDEMFNKKLGSTIALGRALKKLRQGGDTF